MNNTNSRHERKPESTIDEAQRFLDVLAPDGNLTFQTFDDSDEKREDLIRILHGDLTKNASDLESLNSDGAGIFVMVNEGDLKGRKKENVQRVRALFVDLDGASLEPVLDCGLTPHIIVESSPGRYHAYWLITDCPLGQFGPLQKRLAARFNGDKSVNDLPRVMRVPGFLHQKGQPLLTRVHSLDNLPAYTLHQLTSGLKLETSIEAHENPIASPGDHVPQGKRHEAMKSTATRLWNARFEGEPLFRALMADNEVRCKPPLPETEIRGIVSWFEKQTRGKDQNFLPIKVISAAELLQMNLPETNWVIHDLVPEGLTILAGAPKIGKSWLAQELSLSVAMGRPALGQFRCNEGPVLHLALEDNPRRLRRRTEMLLDGGAAPANAFFTCEWPRLADNEHDIDALDHIHRWLENHPNTRLVVIDTFAKIRPRNRPRGDTYDRDYGDLEGLQKLAAQFAIAVLVVHHRNKGDHTDPLNSVSGSTGLTGAADTIMLLERQMRADASGTLSISGRDIEQKIVALAFDGASGRWKWLGDASDIGISEQRQAIRKALADIGKPAKPAEIAEKIGKSRTSVQKLILKMVDDGVVEKAAGQAGRYVLPPEDGLYGQQGVHLDHL